MSSFPEEQIPLAPESADGTLVVVVCRAKHLPNRRKLDKQSPYVTLRIGTSAQRTQSHFRAGQTPEWTQEVRFQLTRDRKPILKLDVLDETKNDPTPIGNTEIDCSVIFATPENRQENGKYIYDSWYDLNFNGKRAGMIYLEMTFYPSAPLVPPKESMARPTSHHIRDESGVYSGEFIDTHKRSEECDINGFASGSDLRQHPYASRPSHSSIMPDLIDSQNSFGQGFPSSVQAPAPGSHGSSPKRGGLNSSVNSDTISLLKNSAGSGNSSNTVHSDYENVFVGEGDAPSRAHKYAAKFHKLKNKLAQKDHLTTLWNNEHSTSPSPPPSSSSPKKVTSFRKERSISPISAYETETDFDQIKRVMKESTSPYEKPRHEEDYHVDDIEFDPPPPPPHLVSSVKSNSPLPPLPTDMAINDTRSSKGPTRKPPSDLYDSFANLHVTSPRRKPAPFSADSIGLDDDYEPKHLTFNGGASAVEGSFGGRHRINPDEIDPRFYAPTPSEHIKLKENSLTFGGRISPVRMREEDLRTSETGYLGDGKFSPSVFQRMVRHDYDDMNESDISDLRHAKPRVPPKIPKGMSESEYYLLEREEYLKDISGNRL